MNLETYQYFYLVAQCVFVLTINYISIDYLYRPSYEWEGFIGIERYEQIAGEDRPVFSFYRPKYFAVKHRYT